jgi:hypothetical protein
MEYVLLRCGCGTVEEVPVHPLEAARGDGAHCAACLLHPRVSVRVTRAAAAGLTAIVVGAWLLWRKPRPG